MKRTDIVNRLSNYYRKERMHHKKKTRIKNTTRFTAFIVIIALVLSLATAAFAQELANDGATAEPVAASEVPAEPTPVDVAPTDPAPVEPTPADPAPSTSDPAPAETPSEVPSVEPSAEPTVTPSVEPTETPSTEPTETPSEEPTESPSEEPTETPSEEPTETPSEEPTELPSDAPALSPPPIDYTYNTVNGQISITGYTGTAVDLTLPSEVEVLNDTNDALIKLPVTEIAVNAFKGNATVKSVIIPEGVKVIGNSAFEGCTSLNKVVLPSTLLTIGDYAFKGCAALSTVVLPKQLNLQKIGAGAFYDCAKLKLTVPASVSLGKNALPAAEPSEALIAFLEAIEKLVQLQANDAPAEDLLKAYKEALALYEALSDEEKALEEVAVAKEALDSFGSAMTLAAVPTKGSCGSGVTYELTGSSPNYTLTISGTGAMKDYTNTSTYSKPPWYNILSEIKSVVVESGVTKIGTKAFQGSSKLNTVTLNGNLDSIGADAFQGCTQLQTVTLNGDLGSIGANAFKGCTILQTVTLNGDLGSIGANAFQDCSNLSTLDFSKVKTIGQSAFQNCERLKTLNLTNVETIGVSAFEKSGVNNITWGDKLTKIGATAFKDCTSYDGTMTIPNCVKTIGANAFQGCTYIKKIVLPTTVETMEAGVFDGCRQLKVAEITGDGSIPNYAFDGCNALESVTIPDTVTQVGEYAFRDCSNLSFQENTFANVKIIGKSAFQGCKLPDSLDLSNVESIGESVFQNRSSLKTIKLPKVTTIGASAFEGCSQLQGPLDLSNVTSMGEKAFLNCSILSGVKLGSGLSTIPSQAFEGCSQLQGLLDLSNVTSLGEKAFLNCSILSGVKLGSGLSTIPNQAFRGCTSLNVLDLSNVTQIGTEAFYNCKGLQGPLDLSNVSTIGNSAFYNCTSLKDVSLGNSLTKISNNMFQNCSALKRITIPDSVTSMGSYAFAGSGLTSITVPDSVTTWDYVGGFFKGCVSLESATLPKGITKIISATFEGCSNLNTFDFSRYTQLKAINGHAFQGTALTYVDLSNTQVNEIMEYAFADCNSLQKVILPGTLANLGVENYSGKNLQRDIFPYSLKELVFNSPTPTCNGNKIFQSLNPGLKIFVPAEYKGGYETLFGGFNDGSLSKIVNNEHNLHTWRWDVNDKVHSGVCTVPVCGKVYGHEEHKDWGKDLPSGISEPPNKDDLQDWTVTSKDYEYCGVCGFGRKLSPGTQPTQIELAPVSSNRTSLANGGVVFSNTSDDSGVTYHYAYVKEDGTLPSAEDIAKNTNIVTLGSDKNGTIAFDKLNDKGEYKVRIVAVKGGQVVTSIDMQVPPYQKLKYNDRDVSKNESQSLNVTIPDGWTDVSITKNNTNDKDFTVGTQTGNTVPVTFKPDTVGDKTGQLTIIGKKDGKPVSMVVDLTGKGVTSATQPQPTPISLAPVSSSRTSLANGGVVFSSTSDDSGVKYHYAYVKKGGALPSDDKIAENSNTVTLGSDKNGAISIGDLADKGEYDVRIVAVKDGKVVSSLTMQVPPYQKLDYGNVKVGDKDGETLNVTIPDGWTGVTITKNNTNDKDFTVGTQTGNTVPVTFKPGTVGDKSGQLTIIGTKDGKPVSMVVDLTGKGVKSTELTIALDFGEHNVKTTTAKTSDVLKQLDLSKNYTVIVDNKYNDIYKVVKNSDGTISVEFTPNDAADYGKKGAPVYIKIVGKDKDGNDLIINVQVTGKGKAATPAPSPSTEPTTQPTEQPTTQPTTQPTEQPTTQPTEQPTTQPTEQPTTQPTAQPTAQPTTQPTTQPTAQPTTQPTTQPTERPSARPTTQPSSPAARPSGQPTAQPGITQTPQQGDAPQQSRPAAAGLIIPDPGNTGGGSPQPPANIPIVKNAPAIPNSVYNYPTYDRVMPDPNDPESPEVIVVIDQDDIPLAYRKTKVDDSYMYIKDESIPLAKPAGHWALVNLILTIATVLLGIVPLLRKYRNRQSDEEALREQARYGAIYSQKRQAYEDEIEKKRKKRSFAWKLIGAIVGVASLIVFILTEDMRLPMQYVDKWTLLMVILAVLQAPGLVANYREAKTEQPNDDLDLDFD